MIKSVLKGSLVAALGTVIFSAETLAFDLQTLSKSLGSAQPYLKTVNALMLALFSAQTERLDKDFDIHLKGSSAHWTMTLVPKKTSALANVFKTMEITGAASPQSIIMLNRQNETTHLQLSKQEKLTRWPDRLEPL